MIQSLPRKVLRFAFVISCVTIISFECDSAWSQRRAAGRSSATAVMGRGIHSYFSGQSAEAERQLSAVINSGSRDPRAYYFRGLARLQQGRQYEAEQDMQLGAALESRNPGSARGISRSLMRVQGTNRRTLEKIRREGRLAASNAMNQESQARSQQMQSRESYVLRKPVQVPVGKLLESSGIEIITPDAQVVQGSYVETAPASKPVEPQVAVEEIPAQATPSPAETAAPAEQKPAKAAPSEPVATPQPELAVESPEAVDNLFETPTEPTATPEPASPEVADNLFAEEPSEPAQPVEGEMEAEETESPVAAPEAADDLFGEEPAAAEVSADPLFEESAESPEPVDPEMEAEADDAGTIDDLFSTESEEAITESTTEAAPAEDEMPAKDSSEEAATDDLFGIGDSATEEPAGEAATLEEAPSAETSTEEASLREESKVGSKKLLGILGRAAGGMVPKPNVSIPEIAPPLRPGAAAPPAAAEDFEFGPGEAFSPAEDLPPAPTELPAPSTETPAPVDELFDLEDEAPPMKDDPKEGIDLFEEPVETPASEATEKTPEESEAPDDTPTEAEASEASNDETAPDEEAIAEEDSSAEETSEEPAEEESTEEDEETDDDPFDLFD